MTDVVIEKKIPLYDFGARHILALSMGLLALLALAGMLFYLYAYGAWPAIPDVGMGTAVQSFVPLAAAGLTVILAVSFARALRRVLKFRTYYEYIRHLEDELKKKDGQLVRKAVLMGRMRPRALPVQAPRPDLSPKQPAVGEGRDAPSEGDGSGN